MHFILISSDPDKILGIHKKCGKNNYFPSMKLFYRKSLFKIVLGQNFFKCQPIFKIFKHGNKQGTGHYLSGEGGGGVWRKIRGARIFVVYQGGGGAPYFLSQFKGWGLSKI